MPKMPFERSKIKFVILLAFLGAVSAHQFGFVIKNVAAKHQPLLIQMYCFSSFGLSLLGHRTIFCHSDDDRKIDIKTVVNLTNNMMELCTNNKLFIRVEEVEKNFEIEKQLVTHCLDTEELMTKLTNHFAVYVSLPSSSATNISNEELAKIEKRKAKNRQKKLKRQDKRKAKLEEKQKLAKNMPETPIADELLESEDDLFPSWVKVSKNLDDFEEMGDKNSATNWQQIAKIYDQSAPFWKQFDLNVLQLSGTDTIILDVVAALSLTMTIRAQNGGVHNEKIAVNEGGDCYCVLLYCYKMTTETTDHQQKELVIFGNPEVDGVPGSGGDQKVVINVELGNLDELPNCQNDELFIYIERDRFGEEHAKPTTMTIPTAQFENNIEDGKMTINLS